MLPKPKQCAAAETQIRNLKSQPLDETRFVFQNAENVVDLLPGIKISDIKSIDETQHDATQLESTHETKFNTEYDFLFTEETFESSNYCNMQTIKPAYNDSNEDISDIELNGNEEEKIYVKEEFTFEIDSIKTEQALLDVKKEGHSYTTPCKGSAIEDKRRDTDTENVNINIEEQAISIKQETTSDEEVSGDDESVSEMAQEGTQVVDKSGVVCEVITQSHMGINNNLSPLRMQRSKVPPGCKEMILPLEDIGFNIYNTEQTKLVAANAGQSSKHITEKMKNEIPIKNEMIFKEDLEMVKEFPSDSVDKVKIPQSVINAPGSTSHNINTKTIMAGKTNMSILESILSGCGYPQNHYINTKTNMAQTITKSILDVDTGYPQNLFTCDICNKSFDDKFTLTLHIDKHPKMQYCSYCSYKTKVTVHLKEHVNAKHTKNEVFRCTKCSYKTYRKSNLVEHAKIKHTRSEIFNCQDCSYQSYKKSSLMRHVNALHNRSEVFNCTHCSYKAYEKSNLARHVKVKHT